MYAGDYLSSNLGHEIINLFASDSGKHYLYLNARGDFHASHQGRIKYMLLTMHIMKGVMEVLGYAKIMEDVYNYGDDHVNQARYIQEHKITYGGISILDIFNDAEQQDVYITYVADKLYIPKKTRVFLSDNPDFSKFKTEDWKIITLNGHKLGTTSLKQYIYPEDMGDDYSSLIKEIEAGDWQLSLDRISSENIKGVNSRSISLFDICLLQNSEQAFSNALYYFMCKPEYKSLWASFFSDCLGCNLTDSFTVTREEVAIIKNDDAGWNQRISGGRIDLFIRDINNYVIIENKIKSDINCVESDRKLATKANQLVRYWNYAHWLAEKQLRKIHVKACVLRPNYSHVDINNPDYPEVVYKDITYRDLYVFLIKNKGRFSSDRNFVSLVEAMERHTFNTVSEYMKHEMEEVFYSRIKELQDKLE